MAHSFANRLQAAEYMDRGQHMGRVGPLAATWFDQLVRLQVLKQRLEQPQFRSTSDEPGAELGQHGIGRLSVGQALDKLEDGPEGELCRISRRLSVLRIEIGE